jgi:peptide-methionine (S)-S-oxide reductase
MIKQAILAGGCFWGMEAKFKHVHGVVNTMVGYTAVIPKTQTTGRSAEI